VPSLVFGPTLLGGDLEFDFGYTGEPVGRDEDLVGDGTFYLSRCISEKSLCTAAPALNATVGVEKYDAVVLGRAREEV
jgi:hypothetical protein